MKRKLSAILLCLCLFLLPAGAAMDIPKPTADFFVNDFANVIDSRDELTMQAAAENLYHACGAQMVVVTLPSLEETEISDISLRLAREWGIGDEDKDNGLLLLFALKEQQVRIEVGSGLEGALPDSKAGRILDIYMLPEYPDYSTALTGTTAALRNEVYIEYGISPDENYIPIDQYPLEDEGDGIGGIGTILLIIGAIILFIRYPRLFWILIHILGRGGGRGGFGSGSSGGRSGGGFSGGGGGFSGGGASR